jgi:hypothetical protein
VSTPHDGGPAFPHKPKKWNPDFGWDDTVDGSNGMGMTLRDYAVIRFMAALIQRDEFCVDTLKLLPGGGSSASVHFIAEELADAMLAAREKGTP